ncbi:TIGR03621 family F420-dependent LLM class oxidoreductase [Streptomyces caatingaensis]|uniref:5,10-methylene tetrahydromethanopterin reductase n=1 Tax=Streptomyces caatingaensis TaxID=1678637 RepID=A0A0K9XME9_9ACTN|nr:TIGR03621 family F420-dependent LLM class oxidoreductase [Streptomyces caatingaensis]KNB53882.1 5,10-methylene tetrahydromethanopterin reductase [Streptomyces caatingaensis]
MSRPFRFAVNLLDGGTAAEWRRKCRRAEALGYDVVLVPDHLGMPAPFPSLVAAADATERPRVGTFVLNAGFHNPALLAREVATTDRLTGGRLELGLGTGYAKAEHDAAGLPFGSPRERVDHLERTVTEVKRLLAGQRPDAPPPLLLGGNGNRVLRLTARHADIAAFTGATTGPDGSLTLITPDALDERVAAYRGFAADRTTPAELNHLVQIVAPGPARRAAAREHAGRLGLTEDDALAHPAVLTGTPKDMAEQLRAHRERYGFSYFTVLEPAMETFGAVIEEVRGE